MAITINSLSFFQTIPTTVTANHLNGPLLISYGIVEVIISPSGLWGIFGGIQDNVYLAKRYVKDHWFTLLVMTTIDIAKISLSLTSRERMIRSCMGSDVNTGRLDSCMNVADFNIWAGIVIFGVQEVAMISLGLMTVLSVRQIEMKPKEKEKVPPGPVGQRSHDNLLEDVDPSMENQLSQPFVNRNSQLPGENRPPQQPAHRVSQFPREGHPNQPFVRRLSQMPPQAFPHRVSHLNHPPQPFIRRSSQLPSQQFPEVLDQNSSQLRRTSTSHNNNHASRLYYAEVNRPQSARMSGHLHPRGSTFHPHLTPTIPRMNPHNASAPHSQYLPNPPHTLQQQRHSQRSQLYQNQKPLYRRSMSQPQIRTPPLSSDESPPVPSQVMESEPIKRDKHASLRNSRSSPDISIERAAEEKENSDPILEHQQLSQEPAHDNELNPSPSPAAETTNKS
ncbi:7174_t:CDS:2 [Acaulospora morrowiae]|uniref:7174_t:CDS:1 n=1 Tax=Acaulospora morrowiae TaxID=94023 RepID=A0A9N9BJR6_9GLOM|nr:7174_t:CDS:2 [Acaulospora morrowiae]